MDDASFGQATWGNPGYAAVSDDVRATAGFDPGSGITNSHYLKATNFGFTIPDGSTILGILVEVEGSKDVALGTLSEARARLVKAGVIQATDRLNTTAWTTVDTYYSHGGASDLWGGTWLPSDINNSGFGFALAMNANAVITARVDHIRITVYYEPGSGMMLAQTQVI